MLKVHLKNLNHQAKKLRQHGVEVSETMTITTSLSQINAEPSFKKAVNAWELKDKSSRNWAGINMLFAKADHACCQLLKHSTKTTGSTSFGSANNIMSMRPMVSRH